MKLDGKAVQSAILQLIEDLKFEPYQIIEIVNLGIKSAFKKDHPQFKKSNIQVQIDENGEIHIYKTLEVVEEVKDENTQISLEEARKQRSDVQLGEKIYIECTPPNLEFSRIAIQAAAQTIKQHLKSIEKERFFEKFQGKQGELLKGKVIRSTASTVIIDIDGIPVVLPPEGQIPNRVYEIGEDIFVYLKQISKGQGGIILDITQSSEDYVEAIIRKIVPEIEEGIVEIKQIARIPGKKTKVVVASKKENVDPVGVFIGQGGDRINIVLSLLDGEKVDYIHFSEDKETLIRECLKPAEIKSIVIKGNTAKVRVAEKHKALAIGKGAVNVKLTSKITGLKVEIL